MKLEKCLCKNIVWFQAPNMFKRAKLKIGAFINHLYKKEFVSFEINILKMQTKKKKKKKKQFLSMQ